MFFSQIFFIAQIQVAQQYSSLTAQNNSVTGTRRQRATHWAYLKTGSSVPPAKSPITLRRSGPFWPVGNVARRGREAT